MLAQKASVCHLLVIVRKGTVHSKAARSIWEICKGLGDGGEDYELIWHENRFSFHKTINYTTIFFSSVRATIVTTTYDRV